MIQEDTVAAVVATVVVDQEAMAMVVAMEATLVGSIVQECFYFHS